MDEIIKFLHTDTFLIIATSLIFLLIIGYITMIVKLTKLNKKYSNFMKKIGNSKNIEEDLENYMYRVEKVEKQNADIYTYIKNIEQDLSTCIQKVGMVRYNAFKDTGSDLSFALALLDENNNGVVLNGIYSREMSNIYAKPITKGESNYTISAEEKEAIKKAIESEKIHKLK